jgi:hypothetical protein
VSIKRLTPLSLVVAVFFTTNLTAATISSTFDSDTEGWTAANVLAPPSHVAAGGNPGGYLFIYNSEGDIAYVSAPAKFLGDLSGFIGGSLSFDNNQLTGTGNWTGQPTFPDTGVVHIIGPTLTGIRDLHPGTVPVGSWQSYSASLVGANWGLSDADFATLMSNVTGIRVHLEATFGDETNGFDNFVLQTADAPAEVPEPSAFGLLCLGLAGLASSRPVGRKWFRA